MQNTKFWFVFIKEYVQEYSCQHSSRVQSQSPWNQLSLETLAGALENCSLLAIKLNPEKAFCKYSISTSFPLQTIFAFEKNLEPFAEQVVQQWPTVLMDLIVILDCLTHNLWEEMSSYELQITDSVLGLEDVAFATRITWSFSAQRLGEG